MFTQIRRYGSDPDNVLLTRYIDQIKKDSGSRRIRQMTRKMLLSGAPIINGIIQLPNSPIIVIENKKLVIYFLLKLLSLKRLSL